MYMYNVHEYIYIAVDTCTNLWYAVSVGKHGPGLLIDADVVEDA